ncbi:glycosyltransferase family 2 protein [Paracoccus aestuariivivens]|nr:glycosyltransferase family 2 protein [Paracoccus aestuariivivens]
MVRDKGLVWADTDIIALKPFPADLTWFFGWERSDRPVLGNAIMGFPQGSKTIIELADFLTSDYPVPPWFNSKGRAAMTEKMEQGEKLDLGSLPWGTTGPAALTHFAKATGELGHAQPQSVFFPISFPQRKRLTDPKQYGTTKDEIESAGSLCVHLYSRWLRKYTRGNPGTFPAPKSWLGSHLAERGLIDYSSVPLKEPKKKGKREPIPPIDADKFWSDHKKRTNKIPDGGNKSRHGRTLCITMAKDEGPYVLEWVAYHHLKGFTDILVYTNDCTDGTDEMLDALATIGLVTRMENGPLGTMPPQSRALKRAQKHPLFDDADWVMVMDFDEFLTIRTGDGKIDDLIDVVEQRKAGAMPITWRFFGSGRQPQYTPEPVTTRLNRAANDGFAEGFGVKTLFRKEDYLRLAIHRPRFVRRANLDGKLRLNWINGSGEPIDGEVMSWRQTRQSAGYKLAQVNHYGVKSGEEFLMRRLRGDVLNNHGKYDAAYFERFDRNEIQDPQPEADSEELAKFCAKLMRRKAIREAAELIDTRYNAKLETLRNSQGYEEQMRALGFSTEQSK